MVNMASKAYDLWFDPNSVGGDLVVECWISHGPRKDDTVFDPQPGDWLIAGDDDVEPIRGRVIRREENRVWLQLQLPSTANAVA
ncbi:MAG: hypothetical protein M1350_08885 [Actinobacteria bacterium]|nr:hypothetical protein [Actinomycetota bacterium]